MSTPTNHWKLGLFVVVGFLVAVGTAVFLGLHSLHTETQRFQSFFDESVQGLEVGSPVKFRGVTIGKVAEIGIAPDHRHVAVSSDLFANDLPLLGVSQDRTGSTSIPTNLRARLDSNGITGVKVIQVDYVNAAEHPAMDLPFRPPKNYLPAAPSMMKSLEDSVMQAVDRMPSVAEHLNAVLSRVDQLLKELETEKIAEKASATMVRLDQVLAQMGSAVQDLKAGELSNRAQALFASLQRTSDALGAVAQGADEVGPQVEDTLANIQAAAESIQRLADELERDPDMIIKGKAKRVSR